MSVAERGMLDRSYATLHREEVIRRVAKRVASVLDAEGEGAHLDLSGVPDGPNWEFDCLVSGCRQYGVYTRRVALLDDASNQRTVNGGSAAKRGSTGAISPGPIGEAQSQLDPQQAMDLLHEGHVVIIGDGEGSYTILERQLGRNFEISLVNGSVRHQTVSRKAITDLLKSTVRLHHSIGDTAGSGISDDLSSDYATVLVASRELSCSPLSDRPKHDSSTAKHATPLRRFLGLLRFEANDIATVILFALVSGILALSTPLAVESLVNVVSWGTYLQPLVVLALILLTSLGLAGVLKILQTVVVEIIQRRQFVRIVGDLAHRFPRAQRSHLQKFYPRELANRVFDIMTIQKATAVLLLDGVSIVLATCLGMMLLAFYHPFLLGFNIALLLTMVTLTFFLGRGGIRTSIDESVAKYKIAHWLQDVISYPGAFKINGGEDLAIDTANGLAADYLAARESQFRVVIRQVMFAIGLQVFASTALLGLGGWLVIGGQLTLGQLVASELVVTVVVGAFAKAGKSLEKFYDLMAGIDKVGYLLDIPVDQRRGRLSLSDRAAKLQWSGLKLAAKTSTTFVTANELERGKTLAVCGDNLVGRGLFLDAVSGLIDPTAGVVSVEEMDATEAALGGQGRLISVASRIEIFRGTIAQNVELGRPGIGINRVREVLVAVGLWAQIHELPNGSATQLQTGGFPLSHDQLARLMLARALATRPRLLVINGLLDVLPKGERLELWKNIRNTLVAPGHGEDASGSIPCTVVLGTDDDRLLANCDQFLEID